MIAAVALASVSGLPWTARAATVPGASAEQARWLLVVLAAVALYLVAMRLIRVRMRRTDPEAGEQRQVRFLAVAFVLLFVGTVLGNLFFTLYRSQQATLVRAEQDTRDLALVLGQQVAGTFASIEFNLDVIARSDLLQSPTPTPALDRLLAGADAHLPAVEAIWVTDANGAIVEDSGRVPDDAPAAGREYFELARRDPLPLLHVARPLRTAGGRTFIPVSRRIERDGRFAGVVAAAVRLHDLERFARAVGVGRTGFLSLMRTDGTVMQQESNMPRELIGQRLLPLPPYVRLLELRDAGTYHSRHPIDGDSERIVSYRRLPGRDLVVLVSVGVDETLAAWKDTALGYLTGTLLFLALILLLAQRLIRTMDRQRVQQARIARLSRMHAAISGVNSLIVRTGSRQELFEGACRIAVEQGGVEVAWIDEYDQASGRMVPAALAGADAAYVLGGDALPAGPWSGAGLPGEGPGWRGVAGDRERRAKERGYESTFTVALFRHSEVVATLNLLAHPPGYFDADEVRLLDELADDLSYALEHLATVQRLEYIARYDEITGLPNRVLLLERMVQALRVADEAGTLCAVVKIDLERFRHINDTVGWDAGDRLLQDIAERLRASLGEQALLARTERDHFVFIVQGLRSEEEAAPVILLRLQSAFAAPLAVDGRDLHLSARAGAALYPADGRDPDTLMRNAEAALARAKYRAERLVFYTAAMNARVAETLAIESRLRTALERDQFVLHYQPKYDARTGGIVGLEALIRWNDPDSGLTPPSQFIGLLEETGLILEVGEWVMQQAVRDQRRWRGRGLAPPRVAVNVSARQLQHDAFADSVRTALDGDIGRDHGLELEITESMLMSRLESNADKLDAVRGMGVRIAIDDFGTGYSSLQYIAKLPLDTLKIDRSFVTGMTSNDTDREIVASVISLAHQLHLKVVAEGVEAPDQARLLRDLDCDEMQGYLFSPPLPAERIETLLRAERRPETRSRRQLH